MNTQTFEPDATLINRELAYRAHTGTSFVPEDRRDQEINGFVADVQDIYDNLIKTASTESETSIINREMPEFQKRYAEKWNAKLASRSRCMSTMITGGANFPTRQNDKANASYDNRHNELMEWREKAINRIHKILKEHQIDAAGGEIEVMKSKLFDAEEMQDRMKAINKTLRNKKTSDEEKVQQAHDKFGLSEHTIHNLMTPDYDKPGFEGWQLSNNNANIKRMKARVIEMQEREDTPTSEIEFDGGTIIDSAEDDRVQIFFDEKPGDEMRAKLKGSGWRWAPSMGVWQRKRTAAAMVSAKQILEVENSV